LRLAVTKGPNRVGGLPSPHLRTQTDTVFVTLCFLLFRFLCGGQSPETHLNLLFIILDKWTKSRNPPQSTFQNTGRWTKSRNPPKSTFQNTGQMDKVQKPTSIYFSEYWTKSSNPPQSTFQNTGQMDKVQKPTSIYFSEYWTMDKVQRPSAAECYTPLSESIRTFWSTAIGMGFILA
jgi:hypothetical protein